MCIGIYISKTGRVSEQRLREAYRANPDGWGILCKWNGEIVSQKNTTDFEDFWNHYRFVVNDCIVHFRTASSGMISRDACHPFYVNENLAFVQNGNLFAFSNSFYPKKDNKTDIMRFNEDILKKLPDGFLEIQEIRMALERYCKANFTKMIFLTNYKEYNKCKVDIINEKAGEWINGCWYSNGGIKNYIGYGYSGAYPIEPGEIRHKGGRITNMLFPPSRRANWIKCNTCGGFFYKLEEENCEDCKLFLNLKAYCKDG